MDMILGINVHSKMFFFFFSVTYVVGTCWNCLIEAIPMCPIQCVPMAYVFSINELFTISFLQTDFQLFHCFSEISM